MRLDLIEVKPKNNKLKIIGIIILAIFLILFFSIMGIYYAKYYHAKAIIKNQIKQAENEATSSKDSSAQLDQREQVKNALLPVYSENARKLMQTIYKSNPKTAYLTFDDGPTQAVTPLILDLLKQENIKATFFVLGANVVKNPDILKRAYLEGHYIANHGYSHNYSKIYKSAESVLEEYNKTEKCIQKAIGNEKYSSHLFRFPGGYSGGKYADIKKKAGKILNENNISYIDWNVLTGDAQGANTKEKIMKNLKKYSKNKGTIVVLMHDASSKILTYETLKEVIDYLRNEGYTFSNFYSIMQ